MFGMRDELRQSEEAALVLGAQEGNSEAFRTLVESYDAVKLNLRRPKARDAAVHALSVKVNNVFTTTCKDVHYDKHLGIADITVKAAKDFCR